MQIRLLCHANPARRVLLCQPTVSCQGGQGISNDNRGWSRTKNPMDKNSPCKNSLCNLLLGPQRIRNPYVFYRFSLEYFFWLLKTPVSSKNPCLIGEHFDKFTPKKVVVVITTHVFFVDFRTFIWDDSDRVAFAAALAKALLVPTSPKSKVVSTHRTGTHP